MPSRFSELAVFPRPTHAFSVVSYNILAPCWATEYTADSPNFKFAYVKSAERLSWPFRRRLLLRQLGTWRASIVCLQEVELDRFEEDFGAFCQELSYNFVVQKRRKNPYAVGNVTLYRSEEFELVEQKTRSRVLMLCLQHREVPAAPPVYVVNVHLQAFGKEVAARVNQLKHVLRCVSVSQAAKGLDESRAATVIAGDFNSNESSAALRLLLNGSLRAGYVDPESGVLASANEISHAFKFAELTASMGMTRLPTLLSPGYKQQLDFIVFTWTSLRLIAGLQLLEDPQERERVLEREMPPNDVFPSDHLPTACVLQFLSTEAPSSAELKMESDTMKSNNIDASIKDYRI